MTEQEKDQHNEAINNFVGEYIALCRKHKLAVSCESFAEPFSPMHVFDIETNPEEFDETITSMKNASLI